MASTDAQALLLKISADVSGMQKQMDKAVGYVDAGSGKMVLRSQQAAAAIEKSFGSVTADGFRASLSDMAKLQDRLTAAQLAGNKAEARALGEQLALQRQVQKAAVLQLETQLAIAKAAGSTKQIAELQELLAVTREVQRLSAVGLIGTKGLVEAEKAIAAVTTAEKAAEKASIGLAATRLFDSAKLATIEEGGARLRVFGSALEPLGAYGLAAAAGVIAFGLSLEEAHKALEFADSLYKIAKNAHVTTDELQATQYALRLSGGEASRAGEGYESFSTKLGLAAAGMPKALRAFKELFGTAFTAQDVRKLGDAGQALLAVTAQIEKLKSPSQKDAVIQQLGLEALKPLIEGGVEKMRELQDEAQKAGQIMDAALITKGHRLNEELEGLHTKIDVQLKTAFIQLGPILVGLAEKLAVMAKIAAEIAGHFNYLQTRTPAQLKELLAAQEIGAKSFLGRNVFAGDFAKDIARTKAEIAAREEAAKPPKLPTGDASLIDQTKPKQPKAVPRDDTLERKDDVAAQLAAADHARLEALKALTDNIQARAAFEQRALDADSARQKAQIDKKIDAINADKGITDGTKRTLTAELELAKVEEDKTTLAKKDLIVRDAGIALADRQIEVYTAVIHAQIDELQAQADIATTAQQRLAIERRILELRQGLEKDLHDIKVERQVQLGSLSPEQGAQEKAALTSQQKSKVTEFDLANEKPVQRYLRSIQDLNTEFENASVTAVKNLSDGLANAIVNAQSLGDVASSVFRQLIAQLLSAALQKDIFGPLLHLIPGFAEGTNYAPGGMALVGERGPELVNLPRGSQITPHNQTLEALRGLSIPQGGGSVTVIQPFHFHAEGAVLTSELLAQANAGASRYANQAAAAALKAARKALPAQQRQYGLLGTP